MSRPWKQASNLYERLLLVNEMPPNASQEKINKFNLLGWYFKIEQHIDNLIKDKIMATTKSKATTPKAGKIEDSEFYEFFVDELKSIYWVEKHLVKALPKMQRLRPARNWRPHSKSMRWKFNSTSTRWNRCLNFWTRKLRPRNLTPWRVAGRSGRYHSRYR